MLLLEQAERRELERRLLAAQAKYGQARKELDETREMKVLYESLMEKLTEQNTRLKTLVKQYKRSEKKRKAEKAAKVAHNRSVITTGAAH